MVDMKKLLHAFDEADEILNGKIENTNKNVSSLKEDIESKGFNGYISDATIICCGDSLTCGDYGSEPEGSVNVHDKNYPYFLAKYLSKTINTDVINLGVCGATPSSWYDTFSSNKNKFMTNKPLVVIMMFGANGGFTDTIETDTASGDYHSYASTNVGFYCKEIEEIMDLSNGMAQIIIVDSPFVDSTRRPVYSNNVSIANPISKKIAAKYNLPFIDVYGELGISSINTNICQPIDGLHMGKIGYSKLGTYIANKVSSLFNLYIGNDDGSYSTDITNAIKINLETSETKDYLVHPDGTEKVYDGWMSYGFIPFNYSKIVLVNSNGYARSVVVNNVSFYNFSKQYISGIDFTEYPEYLSGGDPVDCICLSGTFNVPEGTSYIIVSKYTQSDEYGSPEVYGKN